MNDKDYRAALVKMDKLVTWLQTCGRGPHFIKDVRELLHLSTTVEKHEVKMLARIKGKK